MTPKSTPPVESKKIDLTDTIGESSEDKAKRAVAEVTERILRQQEKPKEE